MKIVRCFLLLSIMSLCFSFQNSGAQIKLVSNDRQAIEESSFVQGYARSLSGELRNYPFPLLGSLPALLTRATDGKKEIVWETEPVKLAPSQTRIKYIWYAGLGCNLGVRTFQLFVNDESVVTFCNLDQQTWELDGKDGSHLSFVTLALDRHTDRFGIMTLTVPRSFVEEQQPLRMRIVGEEAGSESWVMIFLKQIKSEIVISSQPALIKEGQILLQPLDYTIMYLGDSCTASIHLPKFTSLSAPIRFGLNALQMKLPPSEKEKNIQVTIKLDKKLFRQNIVVKPVRKWTIYLVQHTHTDIGYTRPQSEILSEHLRYIDYALEYCDQTDGYPDDAKFRWTCEASWPVWKYLSDRPMEQIERLQRRVREGRIELTGMLFNFGEVVDENSLAAMMQPIAEFKRFGMPVVTAMQNDVNGMAWGLVDYFQECGIKYVTMGINTARALQVFDKPTVFWWQSPSGNKVMAFRADHYNTGNFWGVQTGSIEIVQRELFNYLQKLAEKNYPFDEIGVQYSGYMTDNAPPSSFTADLVRQWNEKYAWPKLRNATAEEFLGFVAENYSRQLPIYQTAWPDWWTDGFGSAMRETAAARKTQAELIASQGLLSMAKISGTEINPSFRTLMEKVQENLLFYNEHTFGAAESISDPLAENTQVQWLEKSAFVWDAVMQSRQLREGSLRLLEPLLPRGREPVIAVFNTLNWPRSGSVAVFIDHQLLPRDQAFTVVDENDQAIAMQPISDRQEGGYWNIWVENIPAMGYKILRIKLKEEKRAASPIPVADATILENEFYRLIINAENGAVCSLFDKQLSVELVDKTSQWQLGQFIYEKLAERQAMEMLRLGAHERSPLRQVHVQRGEDLPLWQSLVVTGASDACEGETGVRCEIRLYKREKQLELAFKIRKKAITDPEGIYIAFPFACPDGKMVFDVQGGLLRPGENQLPGSTSDWNTVQNYAAVKSDKMQIVLSSDEIPLMQFGGINTGRYQYNAKPAKPYMFSWVLNNYWSTNFCASQDGDLSWKYVLTSTSEISNGFATRFGWGTRIPLVALVLPPATEKPGKEFSFSIGGQVLLISAKPSRDGLGIILHLREIEGKPAILTISNPRIKRISKVNVLEEEIIQMKDVQLQPFATGFYKLWVRPLSEN